MKDGGQAFPWGGGIRGGMTLRDWFAGQALTGVIAHVNGQGGNYHQAADDAYAHADAMLATRAQAEEK